METLLVAVRVSKISITSCDQILTGVFLNNRDVQPLQEHFLGWNFPPEHADLVHPHWRVFLAPGRLWHVALAFIYLLLLMLSLLGNGIVIWIFST